MNQFQNDRKIKTAQGPSPEETFLNAWSWTSIMIVSPCRKLWFSKCWNQLVGNFDVYLYAKNQLHLQLLFWDIAKTLKTCYFRNFGNAWLSPLWQAFMLICMQISNFVTHYFLKILQRNSKLVIFGNLSMPGHTHT